MTGFGKSMNQTNKSELESLKQSTSLVALVEKSGVSLKQKGNDLVGCCPFHDDKTPSLVITPDKNLWHCMGACQKGGSVIDWVMNYEGVSLSHAIKILKEEYNPSAEKPVKKSSVPKLKSELTESLINSANHQEALQQVIAYYHGILKESPNALEYLMSRGLNDPELIDHFKLGFADRSIGLILPQKNRKDGEEARGCLTDIGLLRSSGHEHFNGSIIVPIITAKGEITEVYGRKIISRLRAGTPQHLYLPNAHRGVFNEALFSQTDEIILCESLIDAMTFWCVGFKNVTASYGTSGFTADHLAAFKEHNIKKVLIAYDNDDAGNKAAFVLAEKLSLHQISTSRIQFPKSMDANEFGQGCDVKARFIGIVELARHSNNPTPTNVIDDSIPKKISNHEIIFEFKDIYYRVRGLQKNLSHEVLKINVLASCQNNFFVDTFDLYNAKSRKLFVRQTAQEIKKDESIIHKDIGRILLKLEALQDEHIQGTLKTEKEEVLISPEDKTQAMQFLKSPDLMQKILLDFDRIGLVGEATNKLVGYLAAISRKLDKPLALMVQSSSAAGKSSLMDAVLAFIPEEERIQYSAMTGQSLFYMGQGDLKHKVLAIAEEEGIQQACYALKVLQSDGKLNIASTSKDLVSGRLITTEYAVEGPVMIFLTTTSIEVDEELMNRCLVLTVTETREQTEAIHQLQRSEQTLEGLLIKQDKAAILNLHQNAQRLIKPIAVINPFAKDLTFPTHQTRARRDHMKYLTLIKTITLLHQHQREVKTIQHHGKTIEYIEVTAKDIQLANQLAQDALSQSLDELPPQTRTLLNLIQKMAQESNQNDYRFSRRDIREYTSWGNTQIKVHCQRLEDMEYLLVQRIGRSHTIRYELANNIGLYNGETSLIPLIDSTTLNYDSSESGQNDSLSPQSRDAFGAKSAQCRTPDSVEFPYGKGDPETRSLNTSKMHVVRENTLAAS